MIEYRGPPADHDMKTECNVRFSCASGLWQALVVILFLGACHPTVAQAKASNLSSFLLAANAEPVCNPLEAIGSVRNPSRTSLKKQQAEWELGKRLSTDAEQNADMITDDFVVQYINQLEQKIVSRSQLPGCFAVKILMDPEPNAYSLPGGFIYVTTGLVALSDNEGELAAALAHETAHVTARHFSKFSSQSRAWGRVALVGGPVGYLLRRYLGPLLVFSQIRRDEFEADRLGLRYQLASGYDLLEFCTLLQNAIPQPHGTPLLDRLYSTHPATSKRVERLKSLGRGSVSREVDYLVSTSEFQDMKARFASVMAQRNSRP